MAKVAKKPAQLVAAGISAEGRSKTYKRRGEQQQQRLSSSELHRRSSQLLLPGSGGSAWVGGRDLALPAAERSSTSCGEGDRSTHGEGIISGVMQVVGPQRSTRAGASRGEYCCAISTPFACPRTVQMQACLR